MEEGVTFVVGGAAPSVPSKGPHLASSPVLGIHLLPDKSRTPVAKSSLPKRKCARVTSGHGGVGRGEGVAEMSVIGQVGTWENLFPHEENIGQRFQPRHVLCKYEENLKSL